MERGGSTRGSTRQRIQPDDDEPGMSAYDEVQKSLNRRSVAGYHTEPDASSDVHSVFSADTERARAMYQNMDFARVCKHLSRAVCVGNLTNFSDRADVPDSDLLKNYEVAFSLTRPHPQLPGVPSQKFCVAKSTEMKRVYVGFGGANISSDVESLSEVPSPKEFNFVGAVHKGFYHRSQGFPIDVIDEWLNDGYEVVLCGHSLGGAVAAIVALRYIWGYSEELFGEKLARLSIFTFGAPQIGEKDVRVQLNLGGFAYQDDRSLPPLNPENLFYFFVDESDPVPHLVNLFEGLCKFSPKPTLLKTLAVLISDIVQYSGPSAFAAAAATPLSITSGFERLQDKRFSQSITDALNSIFTDLSPFGNLYYFHRVPGGTSQFVQISKDNQNVTLSQRRNFFDFNKMAASVEKHRLDNYKASTRMCFREAYMRESIASSPLESDRFSEPKVHAVTLKYVDNNYRLLFKGENLAFVIGATVNSITTVAANARQDRFELAFDRRQWIRISSSSSFLLQVHTRLQPGSFDTDTSSVDWPPCISHIKDHLWSVGCMEAEEVIASAGILYTIMINKLHRGCTPLRELLNMKFMWPAVHARFTTNQNIYEDVGSLDLYYFEDDKVGALCRLFAIVKDMIKASMPELTANPGFNKFFADPTTTQLARGDWLQKLWLLVETFIGSEEEGNVIGMNRFGNYVGEKTISTHLRAALETEDPMPFLKEARKSPKKGFFGNPDAQLLSAARRVFDVFDLRTALINMRIAVVIGPKGTGKTSMFNLLRGKPGDAAEANGERGSIHPSVMSMSQQGARHSSAAQDSSPPQRRSAPRSATAPVTPSTPRTSSQGAAEDGDSLQVNPVSEVGNGDAGEEDPAVGAEHVGETFKEDDDVPICVESAQPNLSGWFVMDMPPFATSQNPGNLAIHKAHEMFLPLATVIIVVVTPGDSSSNSVQDMVAFARKFRKPILICVNKVDTIVTDNKLNSLQQRFTNLLSDAWMTNVPKEIERFPTCFDPADASFEGIIAKSSFLKRSADIVDWINRNKP